ncbi:MAG: DUF2703 domain-containing protein [Acidobacteria bacterium]|nr:DUF2703 domain-containing protein [Acidobacteriota bacterium]
MADIVFLYFKDCPNWRKALKNLNLILSEEGVNTAVRKVQVQTEAEAIRWKFTGSPTIRIGNRDVDPSFRDPGRYSLSCRKYAGGEGDGGLPPDEMVRRAVRNAFPL